MLGIWFLGFALVVVGYFGPWIPHETAALTVTGFELAEFAKFFPQVQGGVVPVTRGLFLTPIAAVAILLGLVVSRLAARPAVRFVGDRLGRSAGPRRAAALWILPRCRVPGPSDPGRRRRGVGSPDLVISPAFSTRLGYPARGDGACRYRTRAVSIRPAPPTRRRTVRHAPRPGLGIGRLRGRVRVAPAFGHPGRL